MPAEGRLQDRPRGRGQADDHHARDRRRHRDLAQLAHRGRAAGLGQALRRRCGEIYNRIVAPITGVKYEK